jgi:hypothetical protein
MITKNEIVEILKVFEVVMKIVDDKNVYGIPEDFYSKFAKAIMDKIKNKEKKKHRDTMNNFNNYFRGAFNYKMIKKG